MQNMTPYFKTFGLSFLSMSCLISLATTPATLASDHVDSPSITVAGPTYRDPLTESPGVASAIPTIASGKSEDITDIYFFREADQQASNGNVGTVTPKSTDRVCMVMTLNGLTKPGRSNYFAPNVAYQMKISTATNTTSSTANLENAANLSIFNFRFGLPDSSGQQDIYLSTGSNVAGTVIGKTTPYAAGTLNIPANNNPIVNPVVINNAPYSTFTANSGIKVFAGEADDPFYLDFRVLNEGLAVGVNAQNPMMQIAASGSGTTAIPAHNIDNLKPNVNLNRTPGDSFGTSNVNAIVISMPISVIQKGNTANTKFYAWGATYKN